MTQITFQEYSELMIKLDEYEKREKNLLSKLDTAQSMMRGTEQTIYQLVYDVKLQYEKRIKEQKDIIRYLKRRLSKQEMGH